MLAPLPLLALLAAASLAPLAPDLLTPRALTHLQATVKREKLTTRSALLQAVGRQLLAGDEPVQPERFAVPSYVQFEPPANAVEAQAGLKRALATLRRADLVSERTATRVEKQLPSFVHPLQLVNLAASYEADDEWWNPTSITAFVAVLRKHDLVDAAAAARIDAALAAGQLATPFELLAVCKHARAFDLSKYPPDPAVYLPQIHLEVAGLDPALGFQTFSYQVGRDPKNSFLDFAAKRLTVTLRTARATYVQDSFFGTKDASLGPKVPLDTQSFYGVFNKILADARSPARLHLVKFRARDTEINAYDQERFGLILLTAAQAEALRPGFPHAIAGHANYFDASHENLDPIGPARIDQALARYRQLGLLDHLTAPQMAALERETRGATPSRFNGLLETVPDLVASQIFDGGDDDHPYLSLLDGLQRISHGKFAPTDVVDDYSRSRKKGGTRFSFRLNGRSYGATLKSDGKWIDLGCWKVIERAVKEAGLPGRFYGLEDQGFDRALFIYLTPAQHEALVKESLATFLGERR